MHRHKLFSLTFAVVLSFCCDSGFARTSADLAAGRWSEQTANDWYTHQPWLVGSDYIPANAINELEMWQAESFDPKRIDLELGWAQSLGMNTMRVFLHDLLWQQDAKGFTMRVDTFLSIAEKHHIKILFVLFDSCWDPYPQLGPQRGPRPGVHNSGWVQSPGAKALDEPSQYPRLEAYAKGIVAAFASDNRILGWDVWNEPGGTNEGSYEKQEPKDKVNRVLVLLPQAFAWVRSAHPSQPLTSGLWEGDWTSLDKLSAMQKIQLELSDVLSFNITPNPTISRSMWCFCSSSTGRSCALNIWRAAPAARSRASCQSQRNIRWRQSIGDWLREKRRPIIPGIPGSIRMSIINRRSGTTRSFTLTGSPTVKKRLRSSGK